MPSGKRPHALLLSWLSAGNQYWVFTESILDPGFPKNLNEMGSGLPRDRIDAALYYTPNGQTFYFRANKLVTKTPGTSAKHPELQFEPQS